MYRTSIAVLLLTFLSVNFVSACGGYSMRMFEAYGLRSKGYAGLQEALHKHDELQTLIRTDTDPEKNDELQKQLKQSQEMVDRVAGQYHATTSRLFWHTELEQAKLQAAEEGKPILSLRMLGNLTDEYSCANSRFFRTALYANQEISAALRERFVLHWQSVRPVPKVTIDFGDGRKLERTVTGNSAHHLLSSSGDPLDVLPGLYSPQEFLAWLNRTAAFAVDYHAAAAEDRNGLLTEYHQQRLNEVRTSWRKDIAKVAPKLLNHGYGGYLRDESAEGLVYVDALDVAHRAMAKARPEVPILMAIRMSPQKTDRMVTDKLWQRLAALRRPEVKLDALTIGLMRKLNPNAFQAGNLARSKSLVEDPILRLVRNFEESIALDTVRNEYLLHRQIHQWFAAQQAPQDVDALNERVYAELFLTPSSDPWLGLVPPDAYTALQNGGIRVPTAR